MVSGGRAVGKIFFHLSHRGVIDEVSGAALVAPPESYSDQMGLSRKRRRRARETKVPRLLFQGGPDKGREILLTGGSLSVGRQEDNDIVVADRLASRRHARLDREQGQYLVQDVGSRNGTYVNGQRITEAHVLRDGDEIQIGLEFKALYVDPEATGALVTDALVRGSGLWVE